jgi:putative membrane protein (TIGR04086 family)
MQKQVIALLYGWIFIFIFILATSFFLALILQFSEISQWMLSWIAFGVGLLGLFISGLITGMKSKSKGWLIGGLAGVGFTLFIFLVQYLGFQNGFSMEQVLHHFGFIIAATFGGMLGVNLFQEEKE